MRKASPTFSEAHSRRLQWSSSDPTALHSSSDTQPDHVTQMKDRRKAAIPLLAHLLTKWFTLQYWCLYIHTDIYIVLNVEFHNVQWARTMRSQTSSTGRISLTQWHWCEPKFDTSIQSTHLWGPLIELHVLCSSLFSRLQLTTVRVCVWEGER